MSGEEKSLLRDRVTAALLSEAADVPAYFRYGIDEWRGVENTGGEWLME